jgi:hypothetical protein
MSPHGLRIVTRFINLRAVGHNGHIKTRISNDGAFGSLMTARAIYASDGRRVASGCDPFVLRACFAKLGHGLMPEMRWSDGRGVCSCRKLGELGARERHAGRSALEVG